MIHLALPTADENPIVGIIQMVLPFLDLEHGPWVAGGICRRLADGETVIGNSDIDIFSPNEKMHNWACDMIRSHKNNYTSPLFAVTNEQKFKNSVKFDVAVGQDQTVTFQFVRKEFYETAEQMFEVFDFPACMFATDGENLIADDRAPAALASRTLTLHHQPTRPLAARLAKYCAYGFTPGPGVLRAMLGTDLENFNPTEGLTVDEY